MGKDKDKTITPPRPDHRSRITVDTPNGRYAVDFWPNEGTCLTPYDVRDEVLRTGDIHHCALTASDIAAGVIFHSASEGVYTLTSYGSHWEGWSFNRGSFAVNLPTSVDPRLIALPILRCAFAPTTEEEFHEEVKEYALKNVYKGNFSYLCGE